MEHPLTPMEIRILGCLIEKKMATPDYYPLSLNALVNACNQKSNREPVMAASEDAVLDGIDSLTERRMVFQSRLSRVLKYEETFLNEKNFVPEESAILCVLLLRGPQTVGEIRGRTERLYTFEDLDHVSRTMDNLIFRNYAKGLERQPGRKEVRYAHTLGGAVEDEAASNDEIAPERPSPKRDDAEARIQALEEKVEALTMALDELKAQFMEFKENQGR